MFYSLKNLKNMGIKILGTNIQINKSVKMYNPTKLTLHNNVRIDDFTILAGYGSITIKNYIHISSHCVFISGTFIEINNYTCVSIGCKLIGANDDYSGNYMSNPTVPKNLTNVNRGFITIQEHCMIGCNSVIFPNVLIDTGSVIGASSLANKSTDKWTIYAGIPIKKIKDRKNTCEKLCDELTNNLVN